MAETRPCARCGAAHSRNHRYCHRCHAAYMREWRKTHPLTEAQRVKDRARSYAGVYLRRGFIQRRPCACGSPDAKMRHKDYREPILVKFQCDACFAAARKCGT